MYFSRITINAAALDAGAFARLLGQDVYHDHQWVWRLFPERPDAQRDFLFRKEQVNKWPCFYFVSAASPCDESGVWQVETKPYSPRLRQGQKLAFNVRVNPVVTRWEGEEGKRRQVRHDVVMDARKSLYSSERPRPEHPGEGDLIQEAGMSWMQSRCVGWGFSVDAGKVRVDGYRQHRVFKVGQKRSIRFSTLEYTGLLTVDNPDCFRQTLFQGIGKSRGLGCGLLLVKPARN